MGGTAAIVTQEFRGDCGEHDGSLLPVMGDTYNRRKISRAWNCKSRDAFLEV